MDRATRKAGFVERTFDTGDVKLNYAEGPDAGPPLLLIPGQSMPWQSYQRVLPRLSRRFHVFAVDVRGHGRSGWTPGQYTFNNMGRDFVALLRDVVRAPAIVSGNSSGGVIAVWLAAYAPEFVRAIIPEDPPLFSCEWPRLRDDTWVYKLFQLCVETLARPEGKDLAGFFSRLELPVQGNAHLMKFPRPLAVFVGAVLRAYRQVRPTGPVDLPFLPLPVRLFVRGLSEYDPEFTKAFLDGSPGEGFSHEEALKQVRCPMLLLQAHSFRHPTHGLVGAMDEEDVRRVRSLVPHCEHVHLPAAHQIHVDRPDWFITEIVRVASALEESPPAASSRVG
jgi:pimeloyl-ACP methyl ester carboxylesterase